MIFVSEFETRATIATTQRCTTFFRRTLYTSSIRELLDLLSQNLNLERKKKTAMIPDEKSHGLGEKRESCRKKWPIIFLFSDDSISRLRIPPSFRSHFRQKKKAYRSLYRSMRHDVVSQPKISSHRCFFFDIYASQGFPKSRRIVVVLFFSI